MRLSTVLGRFSSLFFLCVQSLKGLPGEARRVEKQLVDLWEAGIVALAKRVEHQQIIADLMFFACLEGRLWSLGMVLRHRGTSWT